MVRNEERSLAALYSEPYDFGFAFRDDAAVFANVKEFAAVHEIDGSEVICTVISSPASEADTVTGVYRDRRVLWASAGSIGRPYPGMQVRLDGKHYEVTGAVLIGGEIWKASLEGGMPQ